MKSFKFKNGTYTGQAKSKNKRKLIATFKGFWNKNLDVVKKNLVIHD
jgi:hypothetical protein